jgi:hypothetical protein
LTTCETMRGDYTNLKTTIDGYVKEKRISVTYADVILGEFMCSKNSYLYSARNDEVK